jgi:DNA (cytosine-5)-methyltransferase 1
MKVLSLFSGVGGFDLGLEAAGMETVFQCEWDKHATNILERHWPHVPRWGDISTLTGKHILAHAPVIDVVAWGSPCQDLSVAGKRTGLEGQRSGLFHEGMRIIKELRKETNNEYPRISIWENVAGALSSNRGDDFGIILDEMAEAGALVIEWAVLDAQYFGVAQRRKRIYVIAIFDSAISRSCPNPLLPVSEGLPRHIEESQSAWKKATETVGGSVAYTKSRRAQSVDDYETWIENVVNPTLNQFDQGDIRTTTAITQLVLFENSYRDGARIAKEQITQTLSAKMGTGGGNTPMVAYSVREDVKNKNFSATPIDQSLALQTMRMSPSSHHAQTVINQNTVVRRLTPLECERLMGWPDNWTAIKADGTPQSDTHRYKQCGNGVASPVAQWIAQQLLKLNTP